MRRAARGNASRRDLLGTRDWPHSNWSLHARPTPPRTAGTLVSVDSYMNFQVRGAAAPPRAVGPVPLAFCSLGTPVARISYAPSPIVPCPGELARLTYPPSICSLAPTPLAPVAQLANSEEYIDGALAGSLGEILIRCNNVLYVRAAPAAVEGAGAGAGAGSA